LHSLIKSNMSDNTNMSVRDKVAYILKKCLLNPNVPAVKRKVVPIYTEEQGQQLVDLLLLGVEGTKEEQLQKVYGRIATFADLTSVITQGIAYEIGIGENTIDEMMSNADKMSSL
jgi:hypothetical protein